MPCAASAGSPDPAIVITVLSGLIQLYRLDGGSLFSERHGQVLLLKTVLVAADALHRPDGPPGRPGAPGPRHGARCREWPTACGGRSGPRP